MIELDRYKKLLSPFSHVEVYEAPPGSLYRLSAKKIGAEVTHSLCNYKPKYEEPQKRVITTIKDKTEHMPVKIPTSKESFDNDLERAVALISSEVRADALIICIDTDWSYFNIVAYEKGEL